MAMTVDAWAPLPNDCRAMLLCINVKDRGAVTVAARPRQLPSNMTSEEQIDTQEEAVKVREVEQGGRGEAHRQYARLTAEVLAQRQSQLKEKISVANAQITILIP
eukprot:754576-Hanusia_phi.AAC.3